MNCSVPDMTCGHCAATITRAIKETDSGAKVDIDLGTRGVRVQSVKPDVELLETIRAAGYTPVIGSTAIASNSRSCCR